jgi:hypothetical protein
MRIGPCDIDWALFVRKAWQTRSERSALRSSTCRKCLSWQVLVRVSDAGL